MNARALGIVVSLFLNVALVFGLVQRASWSRDPLNSTRPSSFSADTAETPARIAVAQTDAPENWTNLSAGSLAEVTERLRTADLPPQVQRAMVRALITKRFATRHQEIADMIRAQPWWTQIWISRDGSKLILAQQKLRREEKELLESLLGPDPAESESMRAGQIYRFGDLPRGTLNELTRIDQDYGELTNDIRSGSLGLMLSGDREKLLYLEQQRRDDIAQLLTPDQLFEYDLRNSPTGWWLRTQLAGMNPSPEEFRAIFKVQHAFMEPFANGNFQLMTAEQKALAGSKGPQLTDLMRAVLTPERFAEYVVKTSPEYLQAAPFVKRLELPASATVTVVTVQQDIMKRAGELRANPTLTPADRAARLGALADEAYARLAPTLGDSGLAVYQQSAGGWLNSLRPGAPASKR